MDTTNENTIKFLDAKKQFVMNMKEFITESANITQSRMTLSSKMMRLNMKCDQDVNTFVNYLGNMEHGSNLSKKVRKRLFSSFKSRIFRRIFLARGSTPETVEDIVDREIALIEAMSAQISSDARAANAINSDSTIKPQGSFLLNAMGMSTPFAAADKLNDLLDDINVYKPEIESVIGDMRNKIDELDVDAFNKCVNTVRSSFKNNFGFNAMVEQLFQCGSVLLLISVGAYNLSNWRDSSFTDVTCAAVVCAIANRDNIAKIYEIFKEWVSNCKVNNQFGLDAVKNFISLGLATTCFKGKTNMDSIANFTKTLGNYHNISKNIETILTFVIESFISFVDFVRLGKFLPDKVRYFSLPSSEIRDVVKNITEICDLNEKGGVPMNEVNYLKVSGLVESCQEILLNKDKNLNNGIITLLRLQLSNVISLKKKLGNFLGVKDGRRAEPVCVLLRGAPGAFKSQAMDFLNTMLLKKLLTPEELEEFKDDISRLIYNRATETKFFDGMTAYKLIFVIDDFGQIRDIAGVSDSEFMTIIRAVNEQPYLLHMAHVDAKGNFFFRAKFIVATTNLQHFTAESIIDINAVKRRFDYVFTVCSNKEYALDPNEPVWSRAVDVNKLPKGPDGVPDISPGRFLEFHAYNLAENRDEPRVYTFDEVVEILWQKKLLKDKWFKQKNDAITTILNETDEPRITQEELFMEDIDLVREQENPEIMEMLSILGRERFHEMEVDRRNALVSAVSTFYKDVDIDMNLTFDDYINIASTIDDCTGVGTVRRITLASMSTLRKMLSKYTNGECYLVGIDDVKADYVRLAAWLGGSSVVVVGAISVISYFYKKFISREPIDNQSWIRNTSTGTSRNSKAMLSKIRPVQPQMGNSLDGTTNDIIDTVLRKSTYALSAGIPGATQHIGYLTMLVGRIGIMPLHFASLAIVKVENNGHNIPERVYFSRIDKESNRSNFNMSLSDFINSCRSVKDSEDKDLVLFIIPECIQPYPNILKYFTSVDDQSRKDKFQGWLVVPGTRDRAMSNLVVVTKKDTPILVNGDFLEYQLTKGYEYRAHTDSGDCGSLLYLVDNATACRKILGLHVAGNVQGYGYSTVLDIESIQSYIAPLQMVNKIEDDVNIDYKPQGGFKIYDSEHFEPLGIYPRDTSGPSFSGIRKSGMYGAWGESDLSRAYLRPFINDEGVEVDPQRLFTLKMVPKGVYIDERLLARCTDALTNDIMSINSKPIPKRVLTIQEAICGISGESSFGPIPRSTSAGIPWKFEAKGTGKHAFWGIDPEPTWDSPLHKKLEERVYNCINMMKQGKRPSFLYQDFLKDETLKKAKVKLGKTRGISSSPLDFTVLCRMYFGSFCLFLIENWLQIGVGIGANPYSFDWHVIANLLKSFNNEDYQTNCFAGDFANYDGSLSAQIMTAVLQVIQHWYGGTEEEQLIRHILWLDITYSKHVLGTKVYQWSGSLPSGNPLTPVVNSLANHILHRLCYEHLTGGSPYDFRKHVKLITLGDDSAGTVSQMFSKQFNELTIASAMGEFGLTYTPDTKEATGNTLRVLEDITFLKRGFVKSRDAGRYIAPLSLVTIKNMPYWRKKSDSSEAFAMQTFNTALEELSLHGRPTYETLAPAMIRGYERAYNSPPERITWYANFEKAISLESYL